MSRVVQALSNKHNPYKDIIHNIKMFIAKSENKSVRTWTNLFFVKFYLFSLADWSQGSLCCVQICIICIMIYLRLSLAGMANPWSPRKFATNFQASRIPTKRTDENVIWASSYKIFVGEILPISFDLLVTGHIELLFVPTFMDFIRNSQTAIFKVTFIIMIFTCILSYTVHVRYMNRSYSPIST